MTRTAMTHPDQPAAAASPGEPSTGRACCGPSCCAGPADSERERYQSPGLLGRQAPGPEGFVAAVRERYEAIAEGRLPDCCGRMAGDGEAGGGALALGAEDLAALPDGANLDLGCGAPLQFLALQPGETVLDLGSGAGVDALIAARRVGAAGRVIGVDMTPAMLARARDNAAAAGCGNVEFRAGRLEALPVGNGAVDAVTSNCVINLVPDKGAVFAEIARVLRPGGRLVISDILLDAPLPEALENDLLAYLGCVAGALQRETYFAMVRAAGLGDLEVLRDKDYLAALAAAGENLPAEPRELAERAGVTAADLAGTVRSVTFQARRPLAAS